MPDKKLWEILKEHRDQREMTLLDLNIRTDVSPTHLSRIERGLRRPSPDVLCRIAGPLGFTQMELLKLAGYLSPDFIDDRIDRFKKSMKAEIDMAMGTLKDKVDSL